VVHNSVRRCHACSAKVQVNAVWVGAAHGACRCGKVLCMVHNSARRCHAWSTRVQVNAVHGGVKVQCVSLGDIVVDGQVLRLLLEVG
jgi:hypothetical protein